MTSTPAAPAEAGAADLVRSIAAAHRSDEGPLLVILHDVQQEFGYVDPSWIQVIAHELNLSRAEVHGVLTFYGDFRTTPPGRSHVMVCRAEACQSVGGRTLAEHAQQSLGVAFGETTDDQEFTLDQVFCLGNCALGPAVQIDGKLYGRVDPQRFDDLVRKQAP
jgi:formate dehydrogenase subunit gamma